MFSHHSSASGISWPNAVLAYCLTLFLLYCNCFGLQGASSDSSVLMWGENLYNAAGFASSSPYYYISSPAIIFPTPDISLEEISQISCGVYSNMLLLHNGTIFGAGKNDNYELTSSLPSNVPAFTQLPNMPSGITHVASDFKKGIAYDNNNHKAWIWGQFNASFSQQSPELISEYSEYSSLYPTVRVNFATKRILDSNGKVKQRLAIVWGSNAYGEFGIGNTISSNTARRIEFPYEIYVKHITSGIAWTVIVTEDNQVLSAGHSCCIGRPTTPAPSSTPSTFTPPPSSTPTFLDPQYIYYPVENLPPDLDIIQLVSGTTSTSILTSEGRVFTWGTFTSFWSSTETPTPVTEIDFSGGVLADGDVIIQIHGYQFQFAAISQFGYIYYWGNMINWYSVTSDILLIPQLFTPITGQNLFVQAFLDSNPFVKMSGDNVAVCTIVRPRTNNCTGVPLSVEYQCLGGIWTPRGTVAIPSLVLNDSLVVGGSLSLEETSFQGISSTITVGDCFYTRSINIYLTNSSRGPTTAESGSRVSLIHQSSSCGDTLATTQVNVQTSDQSECRSTSGDLELVDNGNGRSTYSILFKVDELCTKGSFKGWIILVAVVGGVVVLVLAFVLLATFVKPIKEKIRPFWIRNHT